MARFAFLTDEYPRYSPAEGGLASYLERMVKLLAANGHEVHIFLPGQDAETVADAGMGVVLHVVPRTSSVASLGIQIVSRVPWVRWRRVDELIFQLGVSHQLAEALHRFEKINGNFDLVQSCDLWFRGLFVDASKRPHVIRCSWARDAFQELDGVWGDWLNRASAWFERFSMKRACLVYAPSHAVAHHYKSVWGIPTKIIRPPLPVLKSEMAANIKGDIPPRFFFHFGQIIHRKGTDLAVRALKECHRRGTPVQLVVAGVDRAGLLKSFGDVPGLRALGAITRPEVNLVLARSIGSILPSRIDNLPNTAIESLALDVPIITTRGSSIDEIVVHLENGWIAEREDFNGLADAMIAVWNGSEKFRKPLPMSPALQQMAPPVAVAAFCDLLNISSVARQQAQSRR